MRLGSGGGLPWPGGCEPRPAGLRRRPSRGSARAYPNDEWQRKGATLSDKTARQEFGLTQDEIYDAIDAGTLRRLSFFSRRLRLVFPHGMDLPASGPGDRISCNARRTQAARRCAADRRLAGS